MAKEYKLTYIGNPALRQKCIEVADFSDLEELLYAMHRIVDRCGACGIAAPQVGDSRRVLIARVKGYGGEFINPKMLDAKYYIPSIEGCLSIPWAPLVPKIRRGSIEVSWQDRQGRQHADRFRGFNAIVLQHEMDHLEGILITDFFKERQYS